MSAKINTNRVPIIFYSHLTLTRVFHMRITYRSVTLNYHTHFNIDIRSSLVNLPSPVLSSCLNRNCKSSNKSASIFFIAHNMNFVYSNASTDEGITKKISIVSFSSYGTMIYYDMPRHIPPPSLSSSRASMSLIVNS